MSYCPECGEQVAKADVFCPYCGISLNPPVEDASFSETMVGMSPSFEPTAEDTSAAGPAEEQTPTVEATSADNGRSEDPPVWKDNLRAGNTSENWAMRTESVEIPAEMISHGEAASVSENSSQNAEETGETAEGVAGAEPGYAPSYGAGPVAAPEQSGTATAAGSDQTEQPESDENLDDSFNSDFIHTIPYTPENVAEKKIAISERLKRQTTASDTSGQAEQKNESDPPLRPIERPDLPFEAGGAEAPAKFDSVQIIQKNEIDEETSSTQAPSSESPRRPFVESQNQPRSNTAPNIRNGDTDGRKSAKLKPLAEGTILNGRYEIVRKIGGGGMGAVYLANDRNLGGVLRAVKEMVQSYIESEQQDKAINDFKRESLLLTTLDHPSIPTIFDYFFDEKEARFYLVMKYISGGDLAGRMRAAPEGRIDEKTVTEWAIQIADVLDYLHNHEPPIVYRDLKPANVMIDGNTGRVMLIDFGIARWINKEEKGVTAVGTMGYAPPELFSGNVEPRSDIYSLGSTMFHLLTGADPQSNPLLIFDFQKNPRPRQINPQLSDQIEKILMRAVEYNPQARFSSAAEIRDELKRHLVNLQSGSVTFGIKAAPASLSLSEQAVFCGFCGKQILATDVFCAYCGAQQPIAQQGVKAPAYTPPAVTAKLIVVGTNELETSGFALEKNENLIGRRDPMSNIFPEVDLSKFDPQTKISRRHARIWREGTKFLVEDLGSSNGTVLFSKVSETIRLLPHQPHILNSGDKLRLGDTTLHFVQG